MTKIMIESKEKSIYRILSNIVLRLKGELNYRKLGIEQNPVTEDQIILLSLYVQKLLISEKDADKILRKLLDDPSSREESVWYLILKYMENCEESIK